MDELLRQIVIDLRAMWRYRRLGLITAWVVGALGVAFLVITPDRYEASARIYVNTDSILKPLMAGMTVEPNVDQRIAILSRVVINRPNVEKLLSMIGLDAQTKSREQYEQAADDLTKALRISGTGRDNIYTLTYRDGEPERAKRMIELFASLFVESGKGSKITDTDVAKKFIDEQVTIYEKKLQEAETRLKDFRLRYLGMNPGGGRDYFANMSEASGLLSQAQLQLREAENSRNALKQELARELASEEPRSTPGSAASASAGESLAEIDARIDSMRRNLDVLLQKYTDGHPDVIGARRVIRELEEQRRQLVIARKKDGVPTLPSMVIRGPNAYEQMKVSLAQAEANVASLRTRVAEYADRYNRLKESAKLVPKLDADFAQLNRDYDINKKNYESLIARRESASISGEMQAVSGVGDFRLIDPPRVSPRPVAPNRLLLLPLALLSALSAGVAITYVAIKVRPTFYDGKSLRAATGLPVLGSVSTVGNDAIRRAKRNSVVRFIAGVGALLGAYAAGFVVLLLLTVRAV